MRQSLFCVQTIGGDVSLYPRISLFRITKKTNSPREYLPLLIFLVNCRLHMLYTFSFCATRIPGRIPAPSPIHSFSSRRKRTNQEKGGRPKLPFL